MKRCRSHRRSASLLLIVPSSAAESWKLVPSFPDMFLWKLQAPWQNPQWLGSQGGKVSTPQSPAPGAGDPCESFPWPQWLTLNQKKYCLAWRGSLAPLHQSSGRSAGQALLKLGNRRLRSFLKLLGSQGRQPAGCKDEGWNRPPVQNILNRMAKVGEFRFY